jgi:hypothetical protein
MEVPKTLDWVAARAACSVDTLFEMLAQVIESDVEAIRKVIDTRTVFRLNRPASNKVVVVRDDPSFTYTVTFTHDGSSINVTTRTREREADPVFMAKPRFDQAGVCRLELDGQPMELWQVSRKALEGLFFGDEEDQLAV